MGKGLQKGWRARERRGGLVEYLYLTEDLLFIKALCRGWVAANPCSLSLSLSPFSTHPKHSFGLSEPVKPQNYKRLQLRRNISR